MSQTCTFHNGTQADNILHCMVCGHPITTIVVDSAAYAAEGTFHTPAIAKNPHFRNPNAHERGANNN